METNEPCKDSNTKRIKQPISVPFLWEEIPGTPKKDWKPNFHPVYLALPPPPIVDIQIQEHVSPPLPPIHNNRIQENVSVPFIWEEKPGTPKRDWTPTPTPTPTIHPIYPARPPPPPPSPLPVKLIPFVPFKWEEQPGKPLPFCFKQEPPEPTFLPLQTITNSVRSYERYSQEIDKLWEDGSHSGDGDEGDDEMFESEGSDTDDSFSSAPCILPNCLAPPAMVSRNSSTSSYATGTTSLVGVPFLKSLFPLLPPNSSIVWKEPAQNPPQIPSNDYDKESNCSFAVSKPLTLAELIMMSRRRSNRRRAVQEHSFSMELVKSTIGCCNFGTNNGIQALKASWKKQLRLKLI